MAVNESEIKTISNGVEAKESSRRSSRSSKSSTSEHDPDIGPCFGIRHVMAILLFLATTVCYAMRVNVSIAVVAMSNNTNPDFPSFDWDFHTTEIIQSSFFWGYVVTQIPSGLLAQRLGAKWLLFYGILINSVAALLTPVAANYGDWGAFCAIRVIQGLTQGCLFPCVHSMLSKWAPPEERARIASIAFSGNQIGTIISLSVSGLLAVSAGGWPSIFYVFGALGIVWCIIWVFFSSSSPAEHRLITKAEKTYILNSLGDDEEKKSPSTPWKHLLLSLPMWAIVIAHCAQNWGFWTILTGMPQYMSSVLRFEIDKNGLLSALPYLVGAILSYIIAYIADICHKQQWVTLSINRKICNTLGFWGPAVALIILGYIPNDEVTWAVVLFVLSVGLNAGAYVGFQVNHIDLSPNFASTMMGITNCISNFMSIIAPIAAGNIVVDQTSVSEWRIVFWIAAVVYFAANIIFIIFGSSEIQPWNDPNYNKKTKVKDVEICVETRRKINGIEEVEKS